MIDCPGCGDNLAVPTYEVAEQRSKEAAEKASAADRAGQAKLREIELRRAAEGLPLKPPTVIEQAKLENQAVKMIPEAESQVHANARELQVFGFLSFAVAVILALIALGVALNDGPWFAVSAAGGGFFTLGLVFTLIAQVIYCRAALERAK